MWSSGDLGCEPDDERPHQNGSKRMRHFQINRVRAAMREPGGSRAKYKLPTAVDDEVSFT